MPEHAFDYVIVGAGALGSLVAAHLSHHGVNVALVEKSAERRARIESSGVQVVGFKDVPTNFPAVVSPAKVRELKLNEGASVIVTVPPTEAVATVRSLGDAFPANTPLLSMIGGFEEFESTATWPGEVVLGVVNLESRLDASGNVEASFHNFLWLGNLDATLTPAMKRMQRDLAWVGPTLTTKAIRGMHRGKALYALESALPAIVEAHPARFYAERANRAVAIAIVREGIEIAEAVGATPIAFDFFDPNLYRTTSDGALAGLHAWLEHAWQRHERFRFGAKHDFPAVCGLSWAMSPRNPKSELRVIIDGFLAQADAADVATPALRTLDEVASRTADGSETDSAVLQAAFGEVVSS